MRGAKWRILAHAVHYTQREIAAQIVHLASIAILTRRTTPHRGSKISRQIYLANRRRKISKRCLKFCGGATALNLYAAARFTRRAVNSTPLLNALYAAETPYTFQK